MKKIIITILSIVAVLVLIGVAVGLTGFYKFNFSSFVAVKSDPLNIAYTISGKPYTLINGRVENEIAPGSASKEVVAVYGKVVTGDLNGDGVPDAALILTQNAGGSGTFYYVAEAINQNGIYKGTNAMLIGDRIAPQNINIVDGRALVNYADRNSGESFDVPPSAGKSLYVYLDVNKLNIGELVQNFEGEADPSKMTLGMKTWQWISAAYNDGTKITPITDKFKITFKTNGTFSASTDCNGIGGKYTFKNNLITFSEMVSTQMYCDGSQENQFTKILSETQSFLFTSKGELLLGLKVDSGTALFK